MSVFVHASGFSGRFSAVNGDYTLPLSRTGLVRAALTVGRPGRGRRGRRLWASLPPPTTGYVRLLEVGSIALQVLAYVEPSYAGLRMRESFFGLNGSEKQGPAFRLGMAFAKAFAEQKLSMVVLEHADPLIQSGVLTLASGGKRGDLVGWDADGDWHVIEAKARSSGSIDATTLRQAKEQARNIQLRDQTSGGLLSPATASGSYAALAATPINLYVRDPNGDEPTEYTMNPERVLSAHYDLIRTLVAEHGELALTTLPTNESVRIRVGELPRTGVEVGVHESVYEALRDPSTEWRPFLTRFVREWQETWRAEEPLAPGLTLGDQTDGTWSIGLDGYFVRIRGQQD